MNSHGSESLFAVELVDRATVAHPGHYDRDDDDDDDDGDDDGDVNLWQCRWWRNEWARQRPKKC